MKRNKMKLSLGLELERSDAEKERSPGQGLQGKHSFFLQLEPKN